MTNAPENIWAHPTERQPIAARLRPQARWLRGKFKDHDQQTRDRWIGLANAALSSADVEKTLNTQPGEDQ